jgi:hypothetical protein
MASLLLDGVVAGTQMEQEVTIVRNVNKNEDLFHMQALATGLQKRWVHGVRRDLERACGLF